MSKINTGGPAFPVIGAEDTNYVHEGMTLRDYAALKLFPTLIEELYKISRNRGQEFETVIYEIAASAAFEAADAFIAAREVRP